METTSLGLKKPAGTDLIDIQDFNDNADLINGELVKRPLKNGAASEMTNTFTQSASLTNITSGETQKISFGKIMKSMADYFSHKVTAVAKAYLELNEKMNQVNHSFNSAVRTYYRSTALATGSSAYFTLSDQYSGGLAIVHCTLNGYRQEIICCIAFTNETGASPLSIIGKAGNAVDSIQVYGWGGQVVVKNNHPSLPIQGIVIRLLFDGTVEQLTQPV